MSKINKLENSINRLNIKIKELEKFNKLNEITILNKLLIKRLNKLNNLKTQEYVEKYNYETFFNYIKPNSDILELFQQPNIHDLNIVNYDINLYNCRMCGELLNNNNTYINNNSYCKECYKFDRKCNYLKNKDKIIKQVKKYDKINKKARSRKRQESGKQRIYLNNRYKTNILYRLSVDLRSRLYSALKCKKWKKNTKFSNYIGCTLDELKQHLEKQFKDGMSWENRNKWHIDHIIPLSSAKTREELYKLCHYSNLQPLWAKDNLSKGCKLYGNV